MPADEPIDRFFAAPLFAVVGASSNRQKYGNKVLRAFQQHQLPAVPIHPAEDVVEGATVYRNLTELAAAYADRPINVSIITPPSVTEQVVEEAVALGIAQCVWMQPGAANDAAIAAAERGGLTVIAGGPCVMVALSVRRN